jgi:uncharacterized membrane protein YqiK
MFWMIAAIAVVVLFTLAWWTSGRARGRAIDPRRAMIRSDAYRHSNETQSRFDPGGPFSL